MSIILGPQDPPVDYIKNLIFLIEKATLIPRIKETITLNLDNDLWHPSILKNDNNAPLLLSADLTIQRDVIIQGPPGTGKSYLIAKLCSLYLCQGKKVLVTSLTNKALTELAAKEGLADDVLHGRVYKTNLSTDELKKYPHLKDFQEYKYQAGTLLLSTYYKMSELSLASAGAHFDLVVIEEASQAYLAAIAAARHLGLHCVIIGDQMQLQPIHKLHENDLEYPELAKLFNGLETVAKHFPTSSKYMLNETHRLDKSSTQLTNAFYNDVLVSVQSEKAVLNLPIGFGENTHHSVFLQKISMQTGLKSPVHAINAVKDLALNLYKLNPKLEIAVLSFYVSVVKELQREIYHALDYDENVLVETIDRIQGLTVDICIFFIPNVGLDFSFNPNRFNVATSRAKYGTFIILPDDVEIPQLNILVKEYFIRSGY